MGKHGKGWKWDEDEKTSRERKDERKSQKYKDKRRILAIKGGPICDFLKRSA